MLTRRNLLHSLTALGAMGAGGGLATLNRANAANVSGYKALVCVFLQGGLDNYDTVLPYDQASYDEYAAIRAPLLDQYGAIAGGSTRERSRLLPLNNAFPGANGRQFALPEEMEGLHELVNEQNASIVANVGPLIEPLDRAGWEAQSANIPKRLFSHNDQQSTWQSLGAEGARTGWGGRLADAAQASLANTSPAFTTISTTGNSVFLTGENIRPYPVTPEGGASLTLLEELNAARGEPGGEALYQSIVRHFNGDGFMRSNFFEQDFLAIQRNAIADSDNYNQAFANAPPLPFPFPDTGLGRQLQSIATAISLRDLLGASRQVFFAAIGGFDTHSAQAETLPALQRELSEAIQAFRNTMLLNGFDDDVVLFTASDFGRTLAVNGDGTDHGWGGHSFVVGSPFSLEHSRIHGFIPPMNLGHDLDAGGGRLIPSLSVHQFGGALGAWFGLNAAELDTAFPGRGAFDQGALTLLEQ